MEKMIENAKEELEALETQHPHRFDYLKLELQSFISLLQSQTFLGSLPSTSSATTQASSSHKRKRTSMKRRKGEEEVSEKGKKVRRERDGDRDRDRDRDRVDVVLDKAQACLRKIQELKFSLVC